jgi:hypothetical protein
MSRRPRLVGLLWRWHRRLGLVAALFTLVLATTGMVLNHSAKLGLDRRFIESSLLHRAYGDRSADLPAFQVGEHWLSRAANGRIYLDTREVAACRGDLVGGVAADGLFYAGCAEELLLITSDGELVESITGSTGLPVPLTGIGLLDTRLVVQADESWWLADLEQIRFDQQAPGGALIRQLTRGVLPQAIRGALPGREQWLSWERLLLDLHSGRLAGRLGVLVVDAAGLLLCTLALSGVAMWWLHRRRGRLPNRS